MRWLITLVVAAVLALILSTGVLKPVSELMLMLGMMALIAGRRTAVSKPVR